METLLKLSPAQSLLLRTAARRPDGRVIPPDTLRGGTRWNGPRFFGLRDGKGDGQ